MSAAARACSVLPSGTTSSGCPDVNYEGNKTLANAYTGRRGGNGSMVRSRKRGYEGEGDLGIFLATAGIVLPVLQAVDAPRQDLNRSF